MNPLSKYTSKPYVIGIIAIILVPSIGIAFANSSIADFFLSALYVILLLIICGVPVILPDIRKWMKLQNNPEYLYNEVMEKGSSESFKKLEELAKNGNLEAIYFYALTYYVENSVIPFNAEKTFHWASKAAQKGYGLAQNLLGGLYLNGVGIETDYAEAVSWFEESIKNNVYESEIGLFQCYEQGDQSGLTGFQSVQVIILFQRVGGLMKAFPFQSDVFLTAYHFTVIKDFFRPVHIDIFQQICICAAFRYIYAFL